MFKIQGVINNPLTGGYTEVNDEDASIFVLFDIPEGEAQGKVLNAFASREEAEEAVKAWEKSEAAYSGESLNPVKLETVDQLAETVVLWQRDCMVQLQAIANTPKEVDIKVTIYGKERSLTPSERKAFLEGARVVGEIFKDLPFNFTTEPVNG